MSDVYIILSEPHLLPELRDALNTVGAKIAVEIPTGVADEGQWRMLLQEVARKRQELFGQVAARLGRELRNAEVTALNSAVDAAQQQAADQLLQSQAQVHKAAVESQEKYVSFLSHEVRGGLNGILLTLEVLRHDLTDKPECGESLEDLDTMRRAILETVEMMDRFRAAERLGRGVIQSKPAPIELKMLASELNSRYTHRAAEKGMQLLVRMDENLQVNADPQLLLMVLQNLVANAIKYSSRGTVRVVATKPGPAENYACRISVMDEGMGINETKLGLLFVPLSQTPEVGKGGMGLGLLVARRAAQTMDAKLWAESAPGKGSAFHLDLPVK